MLCDVIRHRRLLPARSVPARGRALPLRAQDPVHEHSGQGHDRGTSYGSAIFYTSEEQRRVAEDPIADVEASGLWPGEVVTELSPVGDFWEAEPEHQEYLERYPNGYPCHFVRPHWKL